MLEEVPKGRSQTGQKIIKAALDLFTEKGFSKATINEIATGAGVAETTIYEHFRFRQ